MRPPQAGGPPSGVRPLYGEGISVPHDETVAILRAPVAKSRRADGRGRWVVAVAVFGVALIAAAVLLPRLLAGSPAFERVATIVVGVGPTQIALAPDGSRAYVTNGGVGTVSVIDTAARRVVDPQPKVGPGPDAVVVAPDGKRVYVTDNTSAQVTVLDAASGATAATIPVGKAPDGLAISPDGKRVYVANGEDGTVTVVDPATNATVGPPIAVGKQPRGMAVSPDGKWLYVTGFGSNDLTLVDTASATPLGHATVGDGPVSVAVSPDGAHVYVVNQRSGTLSVVDTVARTSDVSALKVDASPSGAALDRTGQHLYVTSRDADTVVAVDTATMRAGKRFTVGDAPVAVAVGPKDGLVYVVGQNSTDVSVLQPTSGS